MLLLVLAASAAAALGSSEPGVVVSAARLDEGWTRAVRIGGGAAALGGLIALLAQRRRLRSSRRHGPDPTGTGLRAAAAIMVVLVALALLGPDVRMDREGGTAPVGGTAIDPDAPGPPPPPSTSAPVTEGYTTEQARDYRLGPVVEPGARPATSSPRAGRGASVWAFPSWLDEALLVVLLLGGAVVAARILRGGAAQGEELSPSSAPVAAADAEEGLLASLEEVMEAGGDPRRQITAAYHRLLSALAAAGAPRQPQEAPLEHLGRALGPLGVRPEPMRRLARLYVTAQFSELPVTERHRSVAAEALEESLAALRAAPEEAVT